MSSSANQFAASQRPSSGLCHAQYVGRVGALAVSLGVGFAVATTSGVAHADDSADATAPTNTSTSADESTTTASTSSAEAVSASTGTHQSRRSARNGIFRVFGINPSLSRHAQRSSSVSDRDDDQTNTDVNAAEAGDNTIASGEDEETQGKAAILAASPRNTTSRKSANDIARQLATPRRTQVDQPGARAISQALAPTAGMKVDNTVDTTRASAGPVQASVNTITTVAPKLLPAQIVARQIVDQPTTATTALTPTVSTPVARPAALVSGFLAAVGLVPTLTPPTPAPAPATFVWAVLAFVRREIEQVQRTYLNHTPDAVNDAIRTSEQTSITFDPRLNDRDDDTLKITSVNTTGTHGTVTNDGTTITYTPNAETNALGAGEAVTDTFTYTVSDADSPAHLHGLFGLFSRGHTDTATVTVTITGVNDAPTVANDSYSIGTTTTLTRRVLDNDSDVDGDPLTAALVSGNDPEKGTLVFGSDGTFTYTPKAGFSGTDTFTYEASDGSLTTPGTVTIVVNDAPAVSASAELDADSVTGEVTVTFSYSDSAADQLTVTRTMSPNFVFVQGFILSASDGINQSTTATYRYAPTPEARLAAYNGGPTSETWAFTVSDGKTTTTKTVSVPISPAVTPVSGISVGQADAANGDVSFGFSYLQNASAPSPTISLSVVQNGDVELTAAAFTTDGVITASSLQYTYTPDPDARTAAYNGTGPTSETLMITVDGQSFTVTVPIDPAPAVVTGVIGGDSGDDGMLTPVDVEVSTDGDRGVVIGADGGLTIIERDRDGDGWSVGAGVDVDLGDVRGGVAVDADRAYVGGRDTLGGGRLTVVDLDSRQVREIDGLADRGVGRVTDVAIDRRAATDRATSVWAVDADGTLVEVDAERGRVLRSVETRELEARATGVAVDSSARSVLAVAPRASKVYVASGSRITAVKTRAVATARISSEDDVEAAGLEIDRAIDVDGEVTGLEVSADGRTLYATVTRASGAELVAYDAVSLERVRSVSVGTDTRALAISDDGNRAYVTEGRRVSVVDLQQLAVIQRIDTGSATGVAFVPGRDTVLVTNPTTNSVAVVSNPYRAPTVANADTARTGEDNSVVINVLVNDTDAGGASLTPTVVSGPANGTVTLNADGTYRYTPNADFHGTDTFSYTVTGGTSNAAPTKVSVTVDQAINVALTWNTAPADLDAHLLGPAAANGSGPLHVFYSDRTYEVTTQGLVEAGAFLDIDDMNGSGPEIIEINTRTPGEYVYYVDKFSNDGGLPASGATVTVVDPVSGLEIPFEVPSGSGRYWSVFTMTVSNVGTVTITPLDHLSDTAPTLANPTPGSVLSA